MTIKFNLTPQDYADFFVYQQAHTERGRRNTQKARLVFPAIWLGVFALTCIPDGPDPADWIWVILAMIWYWGIPPYLRWSTRRRVTHIATTGLSRGCVGSHEITVGPEGISDRTDFQQSITRWAGVERVDVSPQHVLVYTGPSAAYILPKGAFGSSEDIDKFIDAVNQYRRDLAA